jgi:hypothetical protein
MSTIDVVTAAIPTKAWNPATVYGKSGKETLAPIPNPTTDPIPIKPKACIKTGAGKFIAVKVVTIPDKTPI